MAYIIEEDGGLWESDEPMIWFRKDRKPRPYHKKQEKHKRNMKKQSKRRNRRK